MRDKIFRKFKRAGGGVGLGVKNLEGGRGGGVIFFQRNKRKAGNFLCSSSFFYLCMHELW